MKILKSLYRHSTATDIIRARESGVPVIGICGGYQMLGREIYDSGVESREGRYPGLGLLDVITSFSGYEKHTVQVVPLASAHPPILSGIGTVKGYEIHMGTTERGRDRPAFGSHRVCPGDGLVIGLHARTPDESRCH